MAIDRARCMERSGGTLQSSAKNVLLMSMAATKLSGVDTSRAMAERNSHIWKVDCTRRGGVSMNQVKDEGGWPDGDDRPWILRYASRATSRLVLKSEDTLLARHPK